MRYFNNPGTFDELDSQFNELLNQYEYRSGKNISTIDEIRTEYKKIKSQMKKRLEAVSKVEKGHNQSYEGRVVENYNTDLSALGAAGGITLGADAAQQKDGQNSPEKQPAVEGSDLKDTDGQTAGRNNYASETVRQSDYDWQKIFQTGRFAPKVQQSSTNAAAVYEGSKNVQSGTNAAAVHEGSKNVQSSQNAAEQAQAVSNTAAKSSAWKQKPDINTQPAAQEDARSLLSICKDDITDIIKEVSRDRTSESYNMLEDVVFSRDDEAVTRWFNTHIDHLASRAKVYRYNEARTKLEKEFRDAAQDRQTEAAYILKIEKMIGAFIKKKFMEYEILYKDYDQDAEQTDGQEEEHAEDKKLKMRGYILGTVMGALIFAIGCFFGLIGMIIGGICGIAAALIIGKTYYAWRMPDEE